MTNTIYDINRLKEIPLKDLALNLGIHIKGSTWNYECFNLEHKNQTIRPSLSITDWEWFYCHKWCWIKWFTAIDLYSQFKNVDFKETCENLSRMYGIQAMEWEVSEFKKPSPKYDDLLKYENYKKYAKDFFNQESLFAKRAKIELENRGISLDSAIRMWVCIIENLFFSELESYNSRNDYKKVKTNYDVIWFPMLDENQKYIWIKIRLFKKDFDSLPEWSNVPKSKAIRWSKNWLLYDSKAISESKEVILCEWEIDWLSLMSLWYDNIITCMWWVQSSMSMIKALSKDKILYCLYDNDNAWHEATSKLADVSNRRIRRVLLPPSDWKKTTDINDKILEWWKKEDFDKALANFVYLWFDRPDTLLEEEIHNDENNNEDWSDSDNKWKSSTKTDKILKFVLNSNCIKLFHDELNDPYVQINNNWVYSIYPCRSRIFEIWLAQVFWKKYKTAIRSDDIKNALNVIESEAMHNWERFELNNRITAKENSIYYDLSDNHSRFIEVNKDWWKISSESLILFKKYKHQKSQIEPLNQWWDIKKVLNYLNFKNKDQELLFLVYLVSLFIPKIPHPIIVFYWSKWASKSTSSRIIRKIVDPSLLELVSLPINVNELVQILDHNWIAPFDNLSRLSQAQADCLCRAVTWDWFSKRELFTNDWDIIYSFRRCIILNWINLSSTKSDLLDRSLIFELDRITKENRKPERTLWKEFKNDLPIILWWIFDTLSKAIKLYPSIKLTELPRMADFAEWWCAITISLWFTQEDFLKTYDKNIEEQNYEVIQEDITANMIIVFMKWKTEWQWTPSQLFNELNKIPFNLNKSVPTDFPKTAQSLSRDLSAISSNLFDIWIIIEKWRNTSWNRYIKIYKKSSEENWEIPSNEISTNWNQIPSISSGAETSNTEANKIIDTNFDAKLNVSEVMPVNKWHNNEEKTSFDAIGSNLQIPLTWRFGNKNIWICQLTNSEQDKLIQEVFNWI